MRMKIVTWNINSVRIRIQHLRTITESAAPDIMCLQETKTEDTAFPLEALKSLGYPHIYFSGEKSYNGVAILSKTPLSEVHSLAVAGVDQKRHIGGTLPDGTQLHNFYVPAGGDIPDPVQNPAYGYKLKFVEDMTNWAKTAPDKTIIVGDFNIAPLEHDVWSHKQLLQVVSHTEPEITRLNALKASRQWCDVGRHFVPESEKLYSWWSYRNRDWKKSNRGRRLDHIWVTPALTPTLKSYETHTDARDWESPSDHVPLVVELNA